MNWNFFKKNKKGDNRNSGPKSNFYLVSFFLTILLIFLSWTNLAEKKIGILDLIPIFYETAREKIAYDGLSTFAYAFFLYSFINSGFIEKFFFFNVEKIKRNKLKVIAIATFIPSVLSSFLSWSDEFIHFYPLINSLFSALGFDKILSILCLFGGSSVGLANSLSYERINNFFFVSFLNSERFKFLKINGGSAIAFRLLFFIFFVSFLILLNSLFYINSRDNNISKEENSNNFLRNKKISPITTREKISFFVGIFFLLTAIASQCTFFASICNKNWFINNFFDNNKIISETENKTFLEAGHICEDDEIDNKLEQKVEKIFILKEEKKKNWQIFGKWEAQSLDCWLIIGAILICLISKLNLIEVLSESMKKSIPLMLIYIFAITPINVIKISNISSKISSLLLPASVVSKRISFFLLIAIFTISFCCSFLISNTVIANALITTLSHSLLAISGNLLLYSALFAWMGSNLGPILSPRNGLLLETLEKNKTNYKIFFQKTWKYFLTLFLFHLLMIILFSKIIINNIDG